MKFSTSSVSSLVLLLPLLAQSVSASPLGALKGGKAAPPAPPAKGNQAAASSVAVSAAASSAVASAAVSAVASSAAASVAAPPAAAATVAAASSGDLQSSLTLDPSVVATGFANDGQDVPAAGQVASLTSSNNFINFCATVANLPITNGQQITTGSCNPAPMGIIAATTNMPSSKFTFPTNGAVLQEAQPFTISMAITNLETGNFVNAEENYFAAPQQVTTSGNVLGHSHVVIDFLDSLNQTTPTNPTRFAFFKGLNDPAQGGILTAAVADGLPAGAYRLSSINTAANHQPVLVAVAQHGSLDDQVYFTVAANGSTAAQSVDFGGSDATQGVPPPASTAAAAAAGTAAASVAAASSSAPAAVSSVAVASAAPSAAASAPAKAAPSPIAVKGGKAPAPPAPPAKGNNAAAAQGKGAQGKGGNNAAAFPFKFGGFKNRL
ncbi:hypothetical protein EW026_g3268 [Hermanssonia centrifuga]|uniref:Uncharacterized protein n=1 Tax=Hermanssonia centrifuga TaxID=98765 RepID=A0A4S4KLR3_9APHY|nr:hypothetical protein EW026_g3268 [Hermanssonia centrifuga]